MYIPVCVKIYIYRYTYIYIYICTHVYVARWTPLPLWTAPSMNGTTSRGRVILLLEGAESESKLQILRNLAARGQWP